MNDFEDRPPPAVGAYWIKEEDYPALLRISDDGDKMPWTWKGWLKIAEEMERGLKAYGHVVLRVHIDPNTFPDWCAAHWHEPGSRRTQKVRRCGCDREIRQSSLTYCALVCAKCHRRGPAAKRDCEGVVIINDERGRPSGEHAIRLKARHAAPTSIGCP
jgi:hypothetical protein